MEWFFLLLLWGLSDPRIAELRKMPKSFINKLYSETQVSGPLGMSGGISHRHAQNPLSGERRKTLSITHHALSPPPSHHHLYIIHLINWLQRFYRIIVSLKRPFVPKSDVKQWFTTTTTWSSYFALFLSSVSIAKLIKFKMAARPPFQNCLFPKVIRSLADIAVHSCAYLLNKRRSAGNFFSKRADKYFFVSGPSN